MRAVVVLHHVHVATLLIGDGCERVGPGRDEERLVVVGRHPAEDLSAKGQLVQKVTGLLHWARVLGTGKSTKAFVLLYASISWYRPIKMSWNGRRTFAYIDCSNISQAKSTQVNPLCKLKVLGAGKFWFRGINGGLTRRADIIYLFNRSANKKAKLANWHK